MKRIQFLKSMIASAAIMMISSTSLLSKKSHKATLLQCNVAGFQHYHGPHMLHRMCCGEVLELRREYENKVDRKAIALYYNGEKIGFIPRSENKLLCKLIDKDLLHIGAEITSVNQDARPWEAVRISVFATKKG